MLRENVLVLGNIGSEQIQTSEGERRIKKNAPKMNKETFRNLSLQQKYHQKNKYLGSSP